MHANSTQTRPTIGVFSYGFSGNFLWAGACEAARQYDVNLIGFAGGSLQSPRGFEAQANVLFELVEPVLIDGLLLDSGVLSHYVGTEALGEFCERYSGIPIVSSEVALKGIPSVLLDFYQGIRELIGHLIEKHQCQRIAFIRGPQESQTAEERYHAYLKALSEYNIPFEPELIAPGSFFAPSGAEAIRLLLDERQVQFDAIAAANDWMALDAIQALQARGIRVPTDVAVVGFDDQKEAAVSVPPLTTAQLHADERGKRGIELLLALLAGQDVPEQVLLPAEPIVRQSCGCSSIRVIQAEAGQYTALQELLPDTLAGLREQILPKLEKLIGKQATDAGWAEQFWESFINDVSEKTPDAFLLAFKEILQKTSISGGDLRCWHAALSCLRRDTLPSIGSALSRAEDLWQQARTLLGEMTEQARSSESMRVGRYMMSLQAIGRALLSAFSVSELMEILSRELPAAGIPSCYLSLYLEPEMPIEHSRLMLAYSEYGRMDLDAEGRRFPSRQLAPAGMFPSDRRYTMVVEALYFRERQLGFVVFEEGEQNIVSQIAHLTGAPGENPLRGQISSALQVDLLVQQVQEHAAELAREQYVTDTFLATVPDRIYFKDRQGRITRANKAHALRLGLKDPSEEIGKSDFDFFPYDVAQSRHEEEERILQTGQAILNKEVSDTGPDGGAIWSLAIKMPLRDERGEMIGTFGISRDITDLKRAEQELRQYRDHLAELVKERTRDLSRSNARLRDEVVMRTRVEQALRDSEQQYRLLAENVPDGIAILQQGKLVFGNSVFGQMLGTASSELLDTDFTQIFPTSDNQALQDWLEQNASEHQEKQQRQSELLRRDGQRSWIEIERAAIMWDGQNALLLTIRDITERKTREQRLEEERVRLQKENLTLKSTIKERFRFGELVGKSPAMQRVYELIISAATSDVNVMIVGESGTGKELIAKTLHQVSTRKAKTFVPVNCASIPETLFEREFFGHHKGAFTGADRNAPGLFDRAHLGTLFLDEVTELTPGTQAKLLRVLQDGDYTPLGSTQPKQANALIVAATNKNCQEQIAQERLRKDFFYRIGVIEIVVPPLRERKEDLPLLVEHILEQYREKQLQVHGSLPADLPNELAMLPGELVQALYTYDWPGNVRELQNVLQRYLATRNAQSVLQSLGMSGSSSPTYLPEEVSGRVTISEAVQSLEKRMIDDALKKTGYHIGKTSELLGMPRRTLQNKLKKYEFTMKRSRDS